MAALPRGLVLLVAGVFGIVAVEVLVDVFCPAAGLLGAAGSIL